jgi:MFS family permease
MVLSAVLGASAIDYQTHFAFRRGELFVASLFSGVGAATMFGAAVAAVVDRAHRIWRAFAVGMAMTSWEVGRMLGFIFVDKILRGYEMLGVGVSHHASNFQPNRACTACCILLDFVVVSGDG